MENILLALDATNIDMSALDFACYLGRLTKSKVTGMLLENLVANEKLVFKKMYGSIYPDWQVDETNPEVKEKMSLIETNIRRFKEACENRGVQFDIHRHTGVPAGEVIYESRYADLVVTDAATSFKKTFEGTPTHFVKDVLKDSECPVIIAPENFEGIDEIIFTYDGSRSSVFAMKQFTYLFPQFRDKKVTVFHVNEWTDWKTEEKQKIKGWLQNHYADIAFSVATGEVSFELFSKVFKLKNLFIVMGAYGRSTFSRLFKHSHADLLLKTVTAPLFIAHY